MLIRVTDKDALDSYMVDASNSRGNADTVFFPRDIDEVSEAVRSCHEAGRALHIAGNGTGLVGGRVPAYGDVLSLQRMQSFSIDATRRIGNVQSGLSMNEWQSHVNAEHLLYPPDPTEWSAAMGGTFATNASGARTFRYGPTRRFVQALDIVLADGDRLHLRRGAVCERDGYLHIKSISGVSYDVPVPSYSMPATRKHAAGYFASKGMDAVDLFIGSEGTLGVIVSAEVALVAQPERVLGVVVFFDDMDSLLDAVEELRAQSRRFDFSDAADTHALQPRLVEFFDTHALRMIRPSYPSLPERATCAVWMEQEFKEKDEDRVLEGWDAFLRRHTGMADETWFALDERRHAELRAFRHALPSAVYEKVSGSYSTKIGTDIAVPPDAFRSFVRFYETIFNENGCEYVLFGHIGDCHLHANIFAHDEQTHSRMLNVYDECIAEGLRLGGTVSAEHGIGKLKKKYLRTMFGDDGIAQMRAVKRVLDPSGTLSPSNMFD